MFQSTDSFNIDLSSWIISSVTNMEGMFYAAAAYDQTLCGNTWVKSTASKVNMFLDIESQAKIGTEICSCGPGTYLTTTTPKTCLNCTNGKYQDEQGFKETSCTKECSVGKFSNEIGLALDNDCKLCSAGKWSNQLGLVSNDECSPCSSGRYSSEEGQVSIEDCKKW